MKNSNQEQNFINLILKKKNYVFGLRLEIFKNENRIYICVNRKELDQIYQRICSMSKEFVFTVDMKNVFLQQI